jgi:hypothetical protein
VSRDVRLNKKPSSGLDPQEHHPDRPPHPCITGRDRENDGGDRYPSAAPENPLIVADPHERGNLKKWTLIWKIHTKRPEEDAETTVMKAHESIGQEKTAVQV